jgi:hypothetical protein
VEAGHAELGLDAHDQQELKALYAMHLAEQESEAAAKAQVEAAQAEAAAKTTVQEQETAEAHEASERIKVDAIFDESDKRELTELFGELDKDGDGLVSLSDLSELLQESPVGQEKVLKAWQNSYTTADGKKTLLSFMLFMSEFEDSDDDEGSDDSHSDFSVGSDDSHSGFSVTSESDVED